MYVPDFNQLKMIRSLFVLLFVIPAQIATAQKVVTDWYRIPGYSLNKRAHSIEWVPEQINGVLVLNDHDLEDNTYNEAMKKGIMIVSIVPCESSLDNFSSDAVLDTIDTVLGELLKNYKIPDVKIVFGGMSVAGTGVVRYAEYCKSGRSKNHIKLTGIFAVDPPLDYERVTHEAKNAIKRNYSEDAVNESKMLLKLFADHYGNDLSALQKASPFCYNMDNGGNADLLKDLPVRIYADPAINWYIENRRKDYYDLNVIDAAAMINQLSLRGNTHAELIITAHREGEHPHSWKIVDQKELLEWCIRLF
jgi:hypothetical protein